MLVNNNGKIITRLAKNSVRTNKMQYGILLLTIVVSAFMNFCVFTIGLTYLEESRLQDIRLNGAEYDIALINGFTLKQKEILRQNPKIKSTGMESYAGYVKSTEFDASVEIGLLWCDETFWEEQMDPVRTRLDGHYPKKRNELLVTEEVLKACGNDELSVGDRFLLTYENNMGVCTEEFVISGIWYGYSHTSAGFVSKAFYDETGYDLSKDGILYIKLKQDYALPGMMQSVKKTLSVSDRQVFAPTDYIENSFKRWLGICGLALVICLSAYLLIYNILYLSVSGKIRYYGMLQALGMTKKQLVCFLVKQMLPIGIMGIFTGILSGVLFCIKCVPYFMKLWGVTEETVLPQIEPMVLICSFLVTGIAVFCGAGRPVQLAANITPAEAVKHRETVMKGKGYKQKKGAFFWRMAFEQLKKDRTKTVIVLLSLAVSLSVFYCLTTIIVSQGERTVMPEYWDSDFVVQNQAQVPEDMDSVQNVIPDSFVEKTADMEGIQEYHIVEGVPVIFPYVPDGFSEMWLKCYAERTPYLQYEDLLEDYGKNPDNYYGMIKGIDEQEFDYLNQSLNASVDKEKFLEGELCIVQYAGSEIPEEYINQTVSFLFREQQYETVIGAVSYEMYYSGSNVGPTLIVSQEYLRSLTSHPVLMSMNIRYRRSFDEEVERELTSILQESPYRNDIYIGSKYENMKEIQEAQGNMMELGTVISLLLLFVGVLNYANTTAGNIQSRKQTFAIMESIGMSGKQIDGLLIREGILYAGFSVLIAATAGTGVTYLCFQSMNYMGIPFKIPVLPCTGAIVLVVWICTTVPLLSYRKLTRKRSIVERLRDYE